MPETPADVIRVGAQGATQPGEFVPTIELNSDLAAVLTASGLRPAEFYTMHWPTGASRWGSIHVLMLVSDLQKLYGLLGSPPSPVQLQLRGLLFTDLRIRAPRQIVIQASPTPRILMDVELVDARFSWRRKYLPATEHGGLNVTTDRRDVYYDISEDDDGTGPLPWTAQRVIDRVALELFGSTPGEFEIPDATGLDTDDGIRDVLTRHLPIPEVLDRVLAAIGWSLVARPSLDTGQSGRYVLRPIQDGQALASQYFFENIPRYLAGGLLAGDTGDGIEGPPAWIESEVPETVVVAFPSAVLPATPGVPPVYRLNVESEVLQGIDWHTGRWTEKATSSGKPAGVVGEGEAHLFDTTWALWSPQPDPDPPVLQNDLELTIRAAKVANLYYARFSAGLCDLTFLGLPLVTMTPWPGCSMIEWSVKQWGGGSITERIVSDINDPIFGWRFDQPLVPTDVASIGRIHAIPRPDGSVLLDGMPTEALQGVWVGSITEVDAGAGGTEPSYKAQANNDPSVAITTLTVPLRPFPVPSVDLVPAAVGDLCLIVLNAAGQYDLIVPDEDPVTTTCPAPAQAEYTPEELRLLGSGR